MTSQKAHFGWLDLSEVEQRRAREYLRQFFSEGTLDELGFGIMRDAFADIFFPATSTIMTHARYLMWVPAIFLRIERERLSGDGAARRLKQLEDDLRRTLVATAEKNNTDARGIIGASSKDELQRYPSTIYWNALNALGLFQRKEQTQKYYLDHLSAYYEESGPRHTDDGAVGLFRLALSTWDKALGVIMGDGKVFNEKLEIPPNVDFSLSPQEATYLVGRYEAHSRSGGPTLLNHLLTQQFEGEFSYPWEVPAPEELKHVIRHAKAFSIVTKGATLLYFELLLNAQRNAGKLPPIETLEPAFVKWWELTTEELAQWDVVGFLDFIGSNCRVRQNDRNFLKRWLELCQRAPNGRDLFRNAEARECVQKRERAVRPAKYRLGQEKYLTQWKAPESLAAPWYSDLAHLPYNLAYRSEIGRVFVREIVAGLRKSA